MKRKGRLKIIVAAIVLIVIGIISAVYFSKHEPWQVTIATATRGGTYFPLGEEFARILERLEGKPIEKAVALPTQGSLENFELISSQADSSADIAFITKSVLVKADQAALKKVRILAKLYEEVVQVVVRNDRNIKSLKDLEGKTVYIGKDKSGTRIIAEDILEAVSLNPKEDNITTVSTVSYSVAADMLISGELDAAIFSAGIPTEAVEKALDSGDCKLLDFGDSCKKIKENNIYLNILEIPANSYDRYQPDRVRTLGTDALLACRKDLDKDLVILILNALFDNTDMLLREHSKAQDIRIDRALNFDELQLGIPPHPGAEKFKKKEEKKLLIATGAIYGKYWQIGKKIQSVLELNGIPARTIHTDGSLENLELLEKRTTLAIMQYDVALASYFGKPERIYPEFLINDLNIPPVTDLRLIAPLHEEKLHIFIRREKLSTGKGTIEALKNRTDLRICLGPKQSGTRILAKTILNLNEIDAELSTLSIVDMESRIQEGDLDVGFFFSIVPSEALGTMLESDEIRLLSIGPTTFKQLTQNGWGFEKTIIEDQYGCQLETESKIETITTRAVLATTKDLPFDVKEITRLIYKNARFIDIARDTMADDLSIPLHPGADDFYKKAGLRASRNSNWAEEMSFYLAIIVLLFGGLKGLILLRREKISKLEVRKIREISVGAGEQHSVNKLHEIRARINRRVEMKWWNLEKLNDSRMRELEDLIDSRINKARLNLSKALLAEIRTSGGDSGMDIAKRLEWYDLFEERIWINLESGELDESQHDFLQKIIDRKRQKISD